MQIYNTNRYGWVKVDSVWFLTQEQANPYLDPTQPTPTASPTAAPTSTPKPGGTPISRAVVTTVSGGLNLRMWASYSAPILLTIPRNATVDVYEYSGNWARIRYAGAEGWVDRSFLTDSGYYPMPTYQPSQGYAYVQTQSGGLNLRSYASYNARILMVIPRFARVEVLSYGSTWSYIRYAGVVGYVVSSYLSYSPIPVVTATPIPTSPIVGNVATVVTPKRRAKYARIRLYRRKDCDGNPARCDGKRALLRNDVELCKLSRLYGLCDDRFPFLYGIEQPRGFNPRAGDGKR